MSKTIIAIKPDPYLESERLTCFTGSVCITVAEGQHATRLYIVYNKPVLSKHLTQFFPHHFSRAAVLGFSCWVFQYKRFTMICLLALFLFFKITILETHVSFGTLTIYPATIRVTYSAMQKSKANDTI